jgi:tetratricopeptide (TPR) repeat protein
VLNTPQSESPIRNAQRAPESAIRNFDMLGSILLIIAVVGMVAVAWRSPSAQGYYDMHRAETLLGQGRYSQAQSLLEETLLTYDSPQLRLDLSYAYLARRDAERAERQARLALDGALPELKAAAWAQLGRVLAFAGRDTEALDAWAASSQAAAPYPDIQPVNQAARSALWHTAMIYWSQADWDTARHYLEALSAGTDVYASSARVKLAQLLAPTQQNLPIPSPSQGNASGNAQAAIPNLRVPGLGEGLPADEMDRTITNLRLAAGQVKQAAQNGANEAEINTIWGGSFLQQGEDKLARDYLQRALSTAPDYEPTHARLALALLNLGQSDAAFQHLDTAVRLDASDPLPHHVLATLYVQSADWKRAKEQLDIIRRLEPAGVEMHLQWAEYYRLLGEYDQAENEYIDAANLQVSGAAAPSGTNAPLTLARFYTDVRGFGCEKGLPAGRQSLALHPDDPASFDAVGWALMLCKQPKDAVSGLEEAVKVAPDVPRYRLHLAKVYAALGRYADAREQYDWVLDLDPGGPLERLALNDLVLLPRN